MPPNEGQASIPIEYAFGIPYFGLKTWEHFDTCIESLMNCDGPLICDIFMDLEQYFYPKLSLAISKVGSIESPPLEDLSPRFPRDEIEKTCLLSFMRNLRASS